MSHPSREGLAVPRGVQYGPCRAVDVAVGGARQERLPAGPLGGEDELVQLDLPVRRGGADHEGTADLAAVAPVVRAQADREEVALLHPPVRGPVPGAAGVRSGADGGREGRAVGAVVDEAALQLQGQVAFGAPDEDRLQQLAEGLVGDLGGDPQAGDLLLVLDQPLLFHGGAQVGQPQPGRDRVQRAVPADGEVVFLHGEGLGASGRARSAAATAGSAPGLGRTDSRSPSSSRPSSASPVGAVPQNRASSAGPTSRTAPSGDAPAR